VGVFSSDDGSKQAVSRWTSQSGMVSLLTLDASEFPTGSTNNKTLPLVAADGSTVVGTFEGTIPLTPNRFWTPFRWKPDTGVVLLPKVVNGVPYDRVEITTVSDDGATLFGRVNGFPGNNNQTLRWTEAGGFEVVAGELDGNQPERSTPDGSVVIISSGSPEEFQVWSAEKGVPHLGPLGGDLLGALYLSIYSISDNGKVVAGNVYLNNVTRAVRWTEGTGLVLLGPLPGGAVPRDGYGMSADGSIMLGVATGGTDSGPYIWDAIHGSRNLRQELINEYGLGASLAGWSLTQSYILSPDGRTIVGQGVNPAGITETWIAYLGTPVPEPSTLLLAALAVAPFAWRRGVGNRAGLSRSSARGGPNGTWPLADLRPGTLPASFQRSPS
jgi:hypothetical protein